VQTRLEYDFLVARQQLPRPRRWRRTLAVSGCGIVLLGAHHAAALIAAGKLKRVLPKFVSRRGDICIWELVLQRSVQAR
jgi:hypothetical protein